MPTHTQVHQRLTKWYAQKCEEILEDFHQGGEKTLEALAIFDIDFEQIDLRKNWIAKHAAEMEDDLLSYLKLMSNIGDLRYAIYLQLIPWFEEVLLITDGINRKQAMLALGTLYSKLGLFTKAENILKDLIEEEE